MSFADEITVEELERDPYPVYARMRREEPVCFVPAVGLWFVTRWEDVEYAASHPELIDSAVSPSPLDRAMGGKSILVLDGDPQKRLRAMLDPSLRPRVVEATTPELVAPIVERLLDVIAPRGEAELMSEYFEPVSVLSLGQILGLGEIDGDTLRRWFHGLESRCSRFLGQPRRGGVGSDGSYLRSASPEAKPRGVRLRSPFLLRPPFLARADADRRAAALRTALEPAGGSGAVARLHRLGIPGTAAPTRSLGPLMGFDLGPADLADGHLREAKAGELALAVARIGDRYVAFETWCTHEECPLSDGWLEGEAVRCACHGALFSLVNGVPLEGPATDPIRLFPARRTAGGRIEVEIPILPA